ncbi:4'-phosphopantetheinyl transferase family protein [Rhodoferax mekongensis]|uniref:4'-phosphopantetheinyl transferase superfamily protein n=1 Tax=Rhodoferax mekongensis TaxID=3068341 RepID=A0ABZ0B4E0_9BURK|nr:4'-phosphopantetheinyl transferase superfamily protein [Rhodoferax sp. TBRC 17307]WNO06534.1 4'-phosphopantetheinyl transferase superfamily protein [Rhodoferax sp. TBRC 17307]
MNQVRIHLRFTEEAAQDLREKDFALISLALRPGLPRAEARKLARATLREAVQHHFGCDAKAVSVETVSGKAPLVKIGRQRVHVSFSYEQDWAFIALDVRRPIGIDVTFINHEAEWLEECVRVAKEFLPPAISRRIEGLAGLERATAFAEEWALHEAKLKCMGLPLQEWTSELEVRLSGMRTGSLGDIAGFMVAYAWKEN